MYVHVVSVNILLIYRYGVDAHVQIKRGGSDTPIHTVQWPPRDHALPSYNLATCLSIDLESIITLHNNLLLKFPIPVRSFQLL